MCQWNKNYRDIGTVFAKAMAQKENQACYQSTVRRQIYSCAQACKVIRDLHTFKKQKDRVKMILWVKTVSSLFCFIENIFQLLILSLRFDFWFSGPVEKKNPSGYKYTRGRELTHELGSSLHFLCCSAPHEAQPRDATDAFHSFVCYQQRFGSTRGLSIY